MKCGDPMLKIQIDSENKISKNGWNIYESNQIKQAILEIELDRTLSNESGNLTFWRFGISKYDQYSIFRYTFQCYWTRISETPSFRIDGCEFWKIYIHSFRIISLLLRIVNEHESSFHIPSSANSPSVMDCNDGRSIQIISFEFIQYFRLLLIRIDGMYYTPM